MVTGNREGAREREREGREEQPGVGDQPGRRVASSCDPPPPPKPSSENEKKRRETVKRLAVTKSVMETGKERASTIPGHHTAGKWRLKDSRRTSHRISEATDEATGHRHRER